MKSMTFDDAEFRIHARLIERLATDLGRIRRGEGPTLEELNRAPILSDWRPAVRVSPALAGSVSGHPLVAAGPAVTSQLFVLDEELGYVRTLNRWYRLGERGGL
jgi:hypothetical protein